MDRFEAKLDQQRLPGRTEARGTGARMGPLLAFLFGLVAAGAGGLLVAGWLGYVELESEGQPPPEWVMPAMGVMFITVGLWVWGLGFDAWRAARAREARARTFMGQRVRIDHDWDPKGDSPPRYAPVAKGFLFAAFLTLFLAPFNMVFVQSGVPIWVQILVGVFDLAGVAVWFGAFGRLGHALKFGVARLEYLRFPYPAGEPIELRWWPPPGVREVERGRFVLRRINEWWEETGSGKSRSRHLVHEASWQGTWHLEHARTLPPGQPVVLRFEPPADAGSTLLDSATPSFWELEVVLEVPGLDYHACHLVPVY
jgi:hypothetical protein